ncbi:MAG: carboxypeptidase-like regulatory domain-containing protein [Chitinispirillaceae bacterium]|nr:carboxypeptidase-like regulatory domain-containing protein [Chitinispirillaceae bacterium]
MNNYYIKIKKYGKIIGKINNSKERVTKVIMYGSTYSAVTDTNGSYIFSYIPEGIYSPIACNINFDLFLLPSVKIVGGDTVAITNSNISFNTFTIEDFEDSISTAKIGRFLLNSRIYKAIANNKGTTVEYNIIQEGIKSSKCLKGQLIRNGAWALIGFFLGEKQEGDSLWDFTNATECSFYAKGKGKINVSFESDTIDKLGYFKHYSADVLLDSEWKLINISLDSLKLKDDGNADPPISWKESAKTIKRIEFNAIEGDTIEVWLDEIMIKGMKFF